MRTPAVAVLALLLAACSRASAPAAGAAARAAPAATAAPSGSLQYRSPDGVAYYAQRDTGAIARAESALAANPRDVNLIIALGIAQSGARQYREAIETFSRGLAITRDNPLLFRWRGHRYISVREFDAAERDLAEAVRRDSMSYDIWYHVGVVRFARGDFAGAAEAFARCQARAPNANELAGSTDWLWMALARAGRMDEARAALARLSDTVRTAPGQAYARRLQLYRGLIAPDSVFTPADTADIQVATLSYGVGNWLLVRGDTAAARRWFERAIASGGWPAFGFILAEAELRRLR
jgi:tetratricopeptide (TPR) repeat protein